MSETYDRLVRLMMEVMSMEAHEIAPENTFNELEVDSLALVELTMVAQKEFGVSIADDDLDADQTVAEAAAVIEAKGVAVR